MICSFAKLHNNIRSRLGCFRQGPPDTPCPHHSGKGLGSACAARRPHLGTRICTCIQAPCCHTLEPIMTQEDGLGNVFWRQHHWQMVPNPSTPPWFQLFFTPNQKASRGCLVSPQQSSNQPIGGQEHLTSAAQLADCQDKVIPIRLAQNCLPSIKARRKGGDSGLSRRGVYLLALSLAPCPENWRRFDVAGSQRNSDMQMQMSHPRTCKNHSPPDGAEPSAGE